jgi:ABC-type nitrate/sulfonate/bicarbonate transport system substrate-binding protein
MAVGDLRPVTNLGTVLPPLVSEGVTVSDTFIEQKPEALRRWLLATSKALYYMQTHEAWTIAFLKRYDGDDNEQVASLTLKEFLMKINPDGAMQPAWMQAGLDLGAAPGTSAPVNKVFLTSFTPVKNFR